MLAKVLQVSGRARSFFSDEAARRGLARSIHDDFDRGPVTASIPLRGRLHAATVDPSERGKMLMRPTEVTLSLIPRFRFEVINVGDMIRDRYDDLVQNSRMITCCSLHTTAGYLEQGLCAKLGFNEERFGKFIGIFQRLFPPGAGYSHDCFHLRNDLNDVQKDREPANGDSHLTFISAGLQNCVTYINQPRLPLYFIELDGVCRDQPRHRLTTVLAHNAQSTVHRERFWIPLTGEPPIASVNLKDPRYGLFPHLEGLLNRYGIDKGIIQIVLGREERHAALTVNEYETLLMRNDLPEAMENPLKYVFRHGKKLLQNPASIPGKTRSYVIYDLIHFYNELMKNRQGARTFVQRVLSHLSMPVSTIFRLQRGINLLISNRPNEGVGRIILGRYQSPILLQHEHPHIGVRCLDLTIRSFE